MLTCRAVTEIEIKIKRVVLLRLHIFGELSHTMLEVSHLRILCVDESL